MQWDNIIGVVSVASAVVAVVVMFLYVFWRYQAAEAERIERRLRLALERQTDVNRTHFSDLSSALEKQDLRSFIQSVDSFEYMIRRLEMSNQEQSELLREVLHQQKQVDGFIHDRFLSSDRPNPLENKLQVITTVTSDVAHTLKTPLSGIKISLELLKKELDGESADRINTLESGVRMLEETIAGYSQLGLTAVRGNLQERIQLSESIISTFKVLALSTNKKVNLEFSIPDHIIVSRELFRYLIIPLASILQNAFESVTDNGIVRVSVVETKDRLQIKIYNNGQVIVGDGHDIYQRGYSTKNSTGLGLTVAKEIINGTLRGELSHQNESDGVTFTVEIPRSSYGQQ